MMVSDIPDLEEKSNGLLAVIGQLLLTLMVDNEKELMSFWTNAEHMKLSERIAKSSDRLDTKIREAKGTIKIADTKDTQETDTKNSHRPTWPRTYTQDTASEKFDARKGKWLSNLENIYV